MAIPVGSGLGTQLRHLLDLFEGDLMRLYRELGLDDYRPRYSPVVRALRDHGPSAIRDLAATIAVTHSAASQTVAQMARAGLVELRPGADARQRIVELTAKAHALLPVLDAEWAAVEAAAARLDAELPAPLGDVVSAAVDALHRQPFRQRIADTAEAPAVHRAARQWQAS